MERVRAAYRDAGITAEIEPFFKDLPARMAASHLVIGRAGASSVAELTVIGRPSILVPLPHSWTTISCKMQPALPNRVALGVSNKRH